MPNGRHPCFFESKAIDLLLAVVNALAGELSVVHKRNDALERILESKGPIDRENSTRSDETRRLDTPERYKTVITEWVDINI